MIEQNFETGTKTPPGLEKPNTVFYKSLKILI